tara:strand:+ start:1912 stop:2817 length:906 start_codon:yes stop_codon:yes gene_type:complete
MVLGLANSITNGLSLGEGAYTASASWDFDGSSDYINCGNSWDLKGRVTDTSENTALSVATWFKIDDIQTTGTTENLVSTIQYPGGWQLQYQNTKLMAALKHGDTSVDATLSITSSWRTLGTDASPLRASGWHHVGFTFDGRYLKLYLNGAQYGSTVDAGSDDNLIFHDGGSGATQGQDANDVDMLIGADPNNITSNDGGGTYQSGTSPGMTPFEGLIHEVGIWDKTLDVGAFNEIFEAVNTDGAVLDLSTDSGNYDYSGDLVALYRATDGIDGTTATNLANPGTHDGSIKNSMGTVSTVPS